MAGRTLRALLLVLLALVVNPGSAATNTTTATITSTTTLTTLYTTLPPNAVTTTMYNFITLTSSTTTTTTTHTTSTVSTTTLTTSTTSTSTETTTTSRTTTTWTSSTSTTTTTVTTSTTTTTTTENPGAQFGVRLDERSSAEAEALRAYLEGRATEDTTIAVAKIEGKTSVEIPGSGDEGQSVVVPAEVASAFNGGSLVVGAMSDEDVAFFNDLEKSHAQNIMENIYDRKNTSGQIEARRLLTKPVSVRIATGTDFASVNGLSTPILITLMKQRTPGATCSYYDNSTREWSTEGVYDHDPNGTALVCATTHLSVFAVLDTFMQGMLIAFRCPPPEFFSLGGLLNIWNAMDRWWRLPATFFIVCVSVFQFLVVRNAMKLDRARQRSFWNDECFLVSRPGFRSYKKKWYEPILETFDVARTTLMNPRGAIAVMLVTSIVQFRVAHQLRLMPSEMKFLLEWANKHLKEEKPPKRKVKRSLGEEADLGCMDIENDDLGWYEWHEMSIQKSLQSVDGFAHHKAFARTSMTSIAALQNTLVMSDSFGHASEDDEIDKREQKIKVSLQQGIPVALARYGFIEGFEDAQSNRLKQAHDYQNSSALALVLVIKKRMNEEVENVKDAKLKELVKVMFIGNQPWMQVRSFSVMKPAADLALILTSKITGAMAAASYTVGMTAHSFEGDPECDVGEDLVMAIGKTVGISIVSIFAGSVPATLFTMLNNPSFEYKERWSSEAREKKLNSFKRRRKILWIVVPIYIFLCLLYTLSFIANVNLGDASRWFRTSSTTLIKMSVIIPLVLALGYAILAISLGRRLMEGALQDDVRNKLMIGSQFGAPMTATEQQKTSTNEAWMMTQQESAVEGQTKSSLFWSYVHSIGASGTQQRVSEWQRDSNVSLGSPTLAGDALASAQRGAEQLGSTSRSLRDLGSDVSRHVEHVESVSIPGQVEAVQVEVQDSQGQLGNFARVGLNALETGVDRLQQVALGRT